MAFRMDPQTAADLERGVAELLGGIGRLGARATRAAGGALLEGLGDMAEEGAERMRRAAQAVREGHERRRR